MTDGQHEATHSQTEARPAAAGPNPRLIAWPLFLVLIGAAAFFGFRATSGDPRLNVSFITADQTEYWDMVVEGAQKAADDYNVELTVMQPTGTLVDQNEMLVKMAASGFDGLAISPVDAVRQAATLREVSGDAALVTVDSDSPYSERICFVGADNYFSGQLCGEMVREALPEGGRILIVCGPLDKDNGRERREGLLDELLGREKMTDRELDPVDTALSAGSFTIPLTLVDPLDSEVSTSKIAEVLGSGENFDVIVGLYGYHAGAIRAAVSGADLGDEAPIIIGFDALPSTLKMIENGEIYGVVAQDQWSYGFNAVRVLAEVARDKSYGLPLNKQINFPPVAVTADTVGYFKYRTTMRQSGG